jgi:peptidoglycan/LPS O-acetylase OafA/YrhL
MASLGVISYGIYLWHLDLIGQVTQWFGWRDGMIPYWMLACAVLAVTVAIASASYFGLERPILRLKGRISWWDRQAPPSEGPPSVEPSGPVGTRHLSDGAPSGSLEIPLPESGPQPVE